jgi:hypothetical protein
MFSLYYGQKNKLLDLTNNYVVDATIQTRVNEPLVLEITFDLFEMKRHGSQDLIDYLIDWKTEMYLEADNLDIGYLFTKRHNQSQGIALIGQNAGNYVLVNGSEILPDPDFDFAAEGIATINGITNIIIRQSIFDVNNASSTFEYILYNDVESSQNMINRLITEEISIAGQVIQDNLLTISLYSTLNRINSSYSQIVFGREYDMSSEQFLQELMPTYDVVVDNQFQVKYKVENKLPLEMLNDVLGSKKIFRDGGFDLTTGRPKIEIYDSKLKQPSVRCVNSQYQSDNPYIINIKENFPTLSASIELNKKYIREGEKVLFDWSNSNTSYRGQFMFEGMKINLLEGYKDGNSNVTLQKTNLDVRRDILINNLSYLSQKSYE